MQMNEHIIDEQTHIWKLIIQHAEFFYEKGDHIFFTILYNFKSLSTRTNEYRELRVDLISLVTSYYARKQAANEMVNTSIINHLAMASAQLLLYISRSYQESLLIERSCNLLSRVLSLQSLNPLKLEDIDRSNINLSDLTKITDDQMNQLLMAICCIFKITVKSLARFKGEFVDLNAEYLKKKIPKVIGFIERNYVFNSLIELLPGSC